MDVPEEFRKFAKDILLFRCRIAPKSFGKFFDTKEGWETLREAFLHKSLGGRSYELLEFEGDVVLNHAVVQYVRKRFPKHVNVAWNTRMKHNLISKKTLADVAHSHGFSRHIVVSDQLRERIAQYDDPMDCRDYQDMNEDSVEALCGAISRIFDTHLEVGAGYRACYNLVSSFLDEVSIPTSYEEIFDAKSRMKILFDSKGWNRTRGCTLGDCLRTFDIGANRKKGIGEYVKSLKGRRPDPLILATKEKFLSLGYVCDERNDRILLAVTTGGRKADSEQAAAAIVVKELASAGICVEPPNPFSL